MKEKFLYVIFVLLYHSHSIIPSVASDTGGVQLSTSVVAQLPQERTHNLVILNDFSEFHQENFFPWDDQLSQEAITKELRIALGNDHLTLCQKVLWHRVQSYAELFTNLATNSVENFMDLYNLDKNNTKLKQTIAEYKELCEPIHQRLNPSYFSQLTGWIGFKKELKQLKIDPRIEPLVTAYAHYQQIITQGYVCKEVTKHFVLFVPQRLVQTIDLDPTDVSKKEDLTAHDLFLGLKYHELDNYPYRRSISTGDSRWVDDDGRALNSALRALTINRQEFTPGYREVSFRVLPSFNIVVSGHGSETITAGLSIQAPATKRSPFLHMLQLLQHSFDTQCLALASCYNAGKKLQDAYEQLSQFDSPELRQLTYPIITAGTTYAPTYVTGTPTQIAVVTKVDVYQDIFGNFFDFLQTHAPPEYIHAANALTGGFYQREQVEVHSSVHGTYMKTKEKGFQEDVTAMYNYATIRFPHTEWFSPIAYGKFVKVLSQVAMSTATKPVIISADTQVVLLGANNYHQPLKCQHTHVETLTFLPSNYNNQDYHFTAIKFANRSDLQAVMSQFLAVQGIKEPINITIKELTVGKKVYKEVQIFMYKQLKTPDKPQYGYSYTDPTDGKRYIAHWNFDDPGVHSTTPKPERSVSVAKEQPKGAKKFVSTVPDPEFMQKLSKTIAQPEKLAPELRVPIKKTRLRRFQEWFANRYNFAREWLLKSDIKNNEAQSTFNRKVQEAWQKYQQNIKELPLTNKQEHLQHLENLQTTIARHQADINTIDPTAYVQPSDQMLQLLRNQRRKLEQPKAKAPIQKQPTVATDKTIDPFKTALESSRDLYRAHLPPEVIAHLKPTAIIPQSSSRVEEVA